MNPLSSINFNAHHSPMGAYMSFTCGHFGTRGGIGVELGAPAHQDLFIGIKEGDRFSRAPLKCLPFFRRPNRDKASDFLVEQAGPAEQGGRSNIDVFTAEQIRRDYGWATDRFSAGELEFSIYTPFGSIPDPESSDVAPVRDALLPAITAELVIDNVHGIETKTAVFAIGFDSPGVCMIDGSHAFAFRNRIGFAGSLLEDGELIPLQRWDISEAIGEVNPVHQLGTCAGFAFEVPPGERRTLHLAIGCYLEEVATTRIRGRYLYTRYFSGLADVLSYALEADRFVERRSVARALDRELVASQVSPDQQFLLAHATRSYYANTQLLDVAGSPFWLVNEGEYCMMNTLDLSVDQAFWELEQNPWVVRNVLDNFTKTYSYVDDLGVSFTHDMGAHNNFSARGQSSYELAHLKGCFSYMTQEQLCNWVLTAACYFAKTRDLRWLGENRHLIDSCAASMWARAHRHTGIMSRDSSRCAGGAEITTYDSLDTSLGQARANAYLAVKCWATWIGLEILGVPAEESLSDTIAQALVRSAGADGVIPAVLEPDSPGYQSRILPAIEGLIYPSYWLKHGALDRIPDRPLVDALKRHAIALLKDPKRRNLFDDGGLKLSSTSSNSWMSKIFIVQQIVRQLFCMEEFDGLMRNADAAHVRWQIEGSAYWACSDQFVSGVAKASRYYPRLVTACLWLQENFETKSDGIPGGLKHTTGR